MSKVFKWKGRVYFGDTDAAKVVHHATYPRWMEAARIDWLTEAGYPYKTLQDEGIGLVVGELSINYKTPLRFGDDFIVHCFCTKLNKASVTIKNIFYKEDSTIACESTVKLICMSEANWKLLKIPPKLSSCINAYVEED